MKQVAHRAATSECRCSDKPSLHPILRDGVPHLLTARCATKLGAYRALSPTRSRARRHDVAAAARQRLADTRASGVRPDESANGRRLSLADPAKSRVAAVGTSALLSGHGDWHHLGRPSYSTARSPLAACSRSFRVGHGRDGRRQLVLRPSVVLGPRTRFSSVANALHLTQLRRDFGELRVLRLGVVASSRSRGHRCWEAGPTPSFDYTSRE